MTREQGEEHWQNTLDVLESVKVGKVIDGEKVNDRLASSGAAHENSIAEVMLVKNQKLLQTLGGILSISAGSSVSYKDDVRRYLDEKFR